MKIVRVIATDGKEYLGIPSGHGHVQVATGDLFAGLVPTDRSVEVANYLAPVAPENIFCIGLNYGAHAEETGAKTTENPVVFMKPSTALNHPELPIILPKACRYGPEVDYEAELAVVIGKRAKDVPVEKALDYVLGYTCGNDVSARRWQKHGGGGQWVRGKSFDGFCPLGPVLVTADEVPDPQSLDLRCILNNEVMQEGNTIDMIFPVAELIAFLSEDTTLLPGTVIMTGTPPGVGFARDPQLFLKDGDTVEVEIEGIGRLVNPVCNA
jgi:2-keto-4-pentenoate hydratase/2-oxohepta-3-ene-1,7-dioic acid hydratase in catechol pathway